MDFLLRLEYTPITQFEAGAGGPTGQATSTGDELQVGSLRDVLAVFGKYAMDLRWHWFRISVWSVQTGKCWSMIGGNSLRRFRMETVLLSKGMLRQVSPADYRKNEAGNSRLCQAW